MRINFIVNEVFDGWEPTDERLGGTELQVVKWAEGLAKNGHEVHVYRNGRQGVQPFFLETGKGTVQYHERRTYYGDGDVCVNVKSSDIDPKEPTIYFTNETNASDLDLSKYDYVVWPSEYAANKYPVNNDKIMIIPHGYDPKELYPGEKISKLCLYASSPDRGLDTLLRVWPDVVKYHPTAQLIVTYGAEPKDIPNVMFMGDVDQATMNELFREADVWAYPCNGGELFCITGLNAQVSGCVPVIIPKMALKETVRHGVFAVDEEDFRDALIDTLADDNERNLIRDDLAHEEYPTWEDSTDLLEELLVLVYNNSKYAD